MIMEYIEELIQQADELLSKVKYQGNNDIIS